MHTDRHTHKLLTITLVSHLLACSLQYSLEQFVVLTMMGYHAERHCPVIAAMLPASLSCSHQSCHAVLSLSSAMWSRGAPGPDRDSSS